MENIFISYYTNLRNNIFEIGVQTVVDKALWDWRFQDLDNFEAWFDSNYSGENLLGLSKSQFFETFKSELETRYEEALEKARANEE